MKKKPNYKELGFDFKEVQKKILKENKFRIMVDELSKEDIKNISLETFIERFLAIYSEDNDTLYAKTKEFQCNAGAYRSLTDIFLCCKYYYPRCTLQQVCLILWNLDRLSTWICVDIDRRIYFIDHDGTVYQNMEEEDELGFCGIIRNGRPIREDWSVYDDYEDEDDYEEEDW